MTSLTDLPENVVDQICREFCVHCDKERLGLLPWTVVTRLNAALLEDLFLQRHTLRNLALVCKKIGTVAQPLIYHTYGFIEDYDSTIYKFCRTISQRPDLAENVQSIVLKHVDGDLDQASSMEWFVPVITRLRSKLRLDLAEIQDSSPSLDLLKKALPAVTILQLPQLKELTMRCKRYWCPLDDIKRKKVALPSQGNPFLPQLQWLSACAPNSAGPPLTKVPTLPLSINAANLGGYISGFSNLKHLDLWNVKNSSVPSQLRLPNVTDLGLYNTVLEKQSLCFLVKATGKLKSFKYSEIQGVGYKALPDMGGSSGYREKLPVTSYDIFCILSLRRGHLKHVAVHTYYRGKKDRMTEPGLGPLSLFSELRSLELNIRAFCNPEPFIRMDIYPEKDLLVRDLPTSLRTLKICAGTAGMKRILPGLVDYCQNTKYYQHAQYQQSSLRLRRIKIHITFEEDNYENGNDAHDPAVTVTPLEWIKEQERDFQQKCPNWWENGQRNFIVSIEKSPPKHTFISRKHG